MGLIEVSQTHLIPLMGGPKYFWRLMTLTPTESNIFGKLLTSNIISVILGESPDPPPLTPLYLYRGEGAYGGRV